MGGEVSIGCDLLALVATVGALVQSHWLLDHPPGHRASAASAWMRRRSEGYFCAVLGLFTLTTAMALPARSAAISGLPWDRLGSVLPEVLQQTHFGRIWLIRAATVFMLWVARFALRALRFRPGFAIFAAFCLAVEAWGWSATGHPGDHGDLTWAVSVAMLHILSAGLWGGTILAVAVVVSPASRRLDALGAETVMRFCQRLSTGSALGLALLVATGIYNAWNELGNFPALWTSAYGQALAIKLGLIAVMAGIGFGNRYLRIPALVHAYRTHGLADEVVPLQHRASRRLFLAIALEAIVLLAIMAMVTVLVHTMPPVAMERMTGS
ncbi:MAG: CopD family protein [Xanthomonadaceae bacterium]|nr:CopD family protein [Xanthomonadaceae bacterium]